MTHPHQALSEFLALRNELDALEQQAARSGEGCGCDLDRFRCCKVHERIGEIEFRQEYLVTQCAGNWALLLQESLQLLEAYVAGKYSLTPWGWGVSATSKLVSSKFEDDARAVLRSAKGE
ncbi:MAG: hypothetical protein JWO19_4399 [Bryobacterales bacterium]|nr:hypothetical protein [Bryobacterales bacterium]